MRAVMKRLRRGKGRYAATLDRPLYFLHIPKTAGSTVAYTLLNAYRAGEVDEPRHFREYSPRLFTSGFRVIQGHMGLAPIAHSPKPLTVVTLLREPAERAWSNYVYFRARRLPGMERLWSDGYTFRDFLEDPSFGLVARNYQARWLALRPHPADPVPAPDVVPMFLRRYPEMDDEELERRALVTLERAALVGTDKRLPEFVEGLSRLVGRRLQIRESLNVTADKGVIPAEDAAFLRAHSAVDLKLLARVDGLLDQALARLPLLPASDPSEIHALPFEQSMADPFAGHGWHFRICTPEAGWHRWTGPGTTSLVELPLRLHGDARLEIHVVSACDDAAVASLQIRVQERPVRHRLESREVGVAAVGDVFLDGTETVTLSIEVSHTALLRASDGTLSPTPAGLAVGTIRLSSPDGAA